MRNSRTRGFTLIELMVSVGLFAVVMTLVSGAYIVLLNLTRQAQAVSTSVDNVSFALEYMTREIRTGSEYGCPAVGQDCGLPGGGNTLVVTDQSGATVVFTTAVINGKHVITKNGSAITDPSIDVSSLTFYAVGTKPYAGGTGDLVPSHVIMVAAGSISTGKTIIPFTIETGAITRGIDL